MNLSEIHRATPIAAAVARTLPAATLLLHADPLQGNPLRFEVQPGCTIASLLPVEMSGEVVVCRYQGMWILRADWQRLVAPGDVVEFHVRPQGGDDSDPLRTILTIALIVVAATYGLPVGEALGFAGTTATAVGTSLIMIGGQLALAAVLPAQQVGGVTGSPETSPTYSVSLAGNQARLDGAIPDLYGYNRTSPDFANQPYVEHDNDTGDQYYHVLLCLGHGEYSVPRIEIDDTPIQSFQDVEVTVLPPGTQPTLVHPAVVTAPEVSGQELLPGKFVGQFAACDAGRVATHLAFDLTFNGLGRVENDGSVTSVGVVVRFEARPIDQVGRSTGTWQTLGTVNVAAAEASVVRRSYKFAVTPGRYKVRAIRTNPKDESRSVLNSCIWSGLRAYLQYTGPVGEPDCTHIQLRMRANEQLNGLTQRRFTVTSIRKLPTWSPSGGWTAPVETRSIAWALANKWRTPYGDGLADARIDLVTLYEMDQLWAQRQDRFDYAFDGFVDSETADSLIAAAGRAAVIRRNGMRTLVRDGEAGIPVTAYSSRSIIPGSWDCKFDMTRSDSADGYIIEYWSNATWDWVPIEAPCPGVTEMQRPVRERLLGVTGAMHAEREALAKAARLAYRRIYPSWTTEMQGVFPAFCSPVVLAPALPGWGLSGDVVAWDAATRVMTLTEPPVFEPGVTHFVSLVRDDGSLTNPIIATPGPLGVYSVVLDTAPDFELVLDAADRERPKFHFGASRHRVIARMLSIEPQGLDSNGAPLIGMSAVVEDDRCHTADVHLLPVGDEVQDPIDLDVIEADDENTGATVWIQDHSVMATGYDEVTVAIEMRNTGGLSWAGTRSGGYPNEWMLTSITPAEAALFEVFAVVDIGTLDESSAATGVWLNLGTTRRWEATNNYVDLHLQIRRVGATEILGDVVISLEPTSLGSPVGGS